MSMPPLDRPLDLDAPGAADFLADLQATILNGHGRAHARLVVATIRDAAAARRWLADFARHRLTTAFDQLTESRRFKAYRLDAGTLFFVGLSHDGYAALDVPAERRPADRKERIGDERTQAFRLGMKAQGGTLGDPPLEQWQPEYRGAIHLLLGVADADEARADATATDVARAIAGFGTVLVIERGTELKGGDRIIEHFGFADGVSQPLFTLQDIRSDATDRGNDRWSPEAPLDLVLTPDHPGADTYGSFLVFRKLEQNVAAFRRAMDAVADLLPAGRTPEGIAQAGALAVGRHADGTPLIDATARKGIPNNFSYDVDPDGLRCPFHAHIRKTNPRGDLARHFPTPLDERDLRIARRGITYGERPDLLPDSTSPPPSKEVGLLFMCCQASLFGFVLQQDGSMTDDFVRRGVGTDPVIGPKRGEPQTWIPGRTLGIGDFVTMQGGEYFFLPSLPYLIALSG